jgi:class 3 adenylate cyclase
MRDTGTTVTSPSRDDPARALRLLEKRLRKSQMRRTELEHLMDASHAFQRKVIKEIEAARAEVERKSRELETLYRSLQSEQARTDQLLRSIMPEPVAEELKATGRVAPRRVDSATVMFADFVAFSQTTEQLDPVVLVGALDTYYSAFDTIIAQHGVEKVKTIGDAYMCVAGAQDEGGDHARRMAAAARSILEVVRARHAAAQREGHVAWDIRIGLNSGPVSSGVVGRDRLSYDIWGNTVNVAARVVKACAVNTVTLSQATRDLIGNTRASSALGRVEAKGIGSIAIFSLNV